MPAVRCADTEQVAAVVPSALGGRILLGTVCGVISAVGYTAANIHLRQAALCDPAWVTCVKALPTVVFSGIVLAGRAYRGLRDFDGPSSALALVGFGLIGQLVGNVGFQWCLGIIGLAMTVPLTMGSIILTGAIVARVWLHEPITPRSLWGMFLLIAAIVVLACGSAPASRAVRGTSAPTELALVAAAVTASLASGLAYTVLSAGIRIYARGRVSLPATMFAISGTGLVSLGLLSAIKLGPHALAATGGPELRAMLAAGVWNAVAFFAFVKALQLSTMVHVNALNSSQIAMASLAGVLMFGENITWQLVIGVLLTVLGLLWMDHRHAHPTTAPRAGR